MGFWCRLWRRDAVLPGCGGEAVGLAQVVGQVGRSKPDARNALPGFYSVGCDAGRRDAGTYQAVYFGFNVALMVQQDLGAAAVVSRKDIVMLADTRPRNY